MTLVGERSRIGRDCGQQKLSKAKRKIFISLQNRAFDSAVVGSVIPFCGRIFDVAVVLTVVLDTRNPSARSTVTGRDYIGDCRNIGEKFSDSDRAVTD